MSGIDVLTVMFVVIGVSVGVLWLTMYIQERRDKSRTHRISR